MTTTAAAKSIPTESTAYRVPAGAFQPQVIDMASGQVLGAAPLPAFYGGGEGVVVSPDGPPGVLALGNGEVFSARRSTRPP